MGTLIPAALPVLPGQSDRVRNFEKEMEPHRAEFERLNKEATVTRYTTHLQESPQGDIAIHTFEVEDPSRVPRSFTDSAYDNWWLDYLRDVHGIDIRSMPSPPSPAMPAFEWTSS